MSKHHNDRPQWREIMQKGRRTRPAGGGDGSAPERGSPAAGAPAPRPQQPLRGTRPGSPSRGAPASGATGSSAKASGAKHTGAKHTGAKNTGSKKSGTADCDPAVRDPADDAAPNAPAAAPRAPQLDGQGLPYITLAQLLKKLSLVGSGGEAKATVRSGGITVNGEAELRPGRKLHQGDKVTISGHDHKVNLASG
jgi:ribosome-associated protein